MEKPKDDLLEIIGEIIWILFLLSMICFFIYYWYVAIPCFILCLIGFNMIEGIFEYINYINK